MSEQTTGAEPVTAAPRRIPPAFVVVSAGLLGAVALWLASIGSSQGGIVVSSLVVSADSAASTAAGPDPAVPGAATALGDGVQQTGDLSAAVQSAQQQPVSQTDPYRPSSVWVSRVAASTGIPARALQAYGAAQLRMRAEQPRCQVGWNTLAALGWIESGHGTHGGATIGTDGYARPVILGPRLSGDGFAAVRDTDGGRLDGDAVWDRAVGPLQFIPSTWARWAADGNGDGRTDPDQIDDAALAAARYLCHAGDLSDAATWRRAVFSYNHSDAYVASVAQRAVQYASSASTAG